MFGEVVTRRRRQQSGTDRYGNPLYTWVDTELTHRAAFDPGGSREPVEVGRTPTVTNPKLFFPTRPDVTSSDVLVVRGRAYTVQGIPADWRDPWGSAVGGLVVELQRAEG